MGVQAGFGLRVRREASGPVKVGRVALTGAKAHAGVALYRIADEALRRSRYPGDTKRIRQGSPADN